MDIAEIRKKAKGQRTEVKRQGQELVTPTPEPRPQTIDNRLPPELVIPTELEYRRSLGYEEDKKGLIQLLIFGLGPEEYALRVEEVREVIKMREVTDVPHTPPFVVGIISLRGEIIPLLDLRRRLNLASTGFTPLTRVVIVSQAGGLMGFVVDKVIGIVKIEERHIEPPPPVKGDVDIEFIRGVVRHDGRFLILLSLPKATEIT